jgi:hypothetical protein
MLDQKILDKCLVVNFCHGERTEKLSDFCFEKLGFVNRINLSDNSGFHEKFLQFSDIAKNSDFEFFIRNDADRLVFDGILDLLNLMLEEPDVSWSTGSYFDYLMNSYRIGTPSVHRKDCLVLLSENKNMMKDVQKPEANFARSIQGKFKLRDVDIFTNLHEYEQYPSKICNAFLNRLARNHYPRLYDDSHLKSLPEHYRNAIHHAFETYNEQGFKNSMVHQDFKFLDVGYPSAESLDIEKKYEEYLGLYNHLKKNKFK